MARDTNHDQVISRAAIIVEQANRILECVDSSEGFTRDFTDKEFRAPESALELIGRDPNQRFTTEKTTADKRDLLVMMASTREEVGRVR